MAEKKVQTPAERIAELEAELVKERSLRSAAEQAAIMAAEAQGFLGDQVMEVPTGKTKKVQVIDKYEIVGYKDDSRPIYKPKFKWEEVPTFRYKILLPPSGDVGLKINGKYYYHGDTPTLDLHLLRTVKDMVFRCWWHERNISGSNENFYKRPSTPQISARAFQ